MLPEIQTRKLSKVLKSCHTHILHLSEFVLRAQKANMTSTLVQHSFAAKDFSFPCEKTALTSSHANFFVVVVALEISCVRIRFRCKSL